jgi:UDP-N-acetylmuramoyl-tripeptide--D-alanyl-D-alanine ligase
LAGIFSTMGASAAVAGILTLAWLALAGWHFTLLLKYFQQHEYDNRRFFAWSTQQIADRNWPRLSGLAALASLDLKEIIKSRSTRKSPSSGPVYTARVKRLLTVGMLALIIEAVLLYSLTIGQAGLRQSGPWLALAALLLALLVIDFFMFCNLILANLILFPIEEALRYYYLVSARRVIRAIDPLVIGITGSYGKTSTKEILAHILSAKNEVLKTPRSYNTLLGVCKVIREELKPKHKIFIVEMGAYKPGEIARICQLVRPKVGILTAIGPMHLERFKTLENVARAKYELIAALPQDGIAIFNADDPRLLALANATEGSGSVAGITPASVGTVKRYSVLKDASAAGDARDNAGNRPDLWADNLQIDGDGTRFSIHSHHAAEASSAAFTVRMRLLGRHNVSNTLAAILAASSLVPSTFRIALKDIIPVLAIMPPFEHRLQPVRGANDVIYIDDAYNSNPVGAKIALEVLAAFNGGRKFLVTPGYVELGEIEAQENYTLGQAAAAVCDAILLVGPQERVQPIRQGFLDGRANLGDSQDLEPGDYGFATLKEANLKLAELVRPGDVVLFENDLPSIYLK